MNLCRLLIQDFKAIIMRIRLTMSGINEKGQRCVIFQIEENLKSKKEIPKILSDAL